MINVIYIHKRAQRYRFALVKYYCYSDFKSSVFIK